mmetsp:Transcript_10297/g.23524  ORF Transcript_10297/g.23524 Transcript_10297/m.23524 type:complete len:276 (+) Transcript_10297:50-877(+)
MTELQARMGDLRCNTCRSDFGTYGVVVARPIDTKGRRWFLATAACIFAVVLVTVGLTHISKNSNNENLLELFATHNSKRSSISALKSLYESANGGEKDLFTNTFGPPPFFEAKKSLTLPGLRSRRPRRTNLDQLSPQGIPVEVPQGYHLRWVPVNKLRGSKSATPRGGVDEVPFFPLPSDSKIADDSRHLIWVPDDCDNDQDGQLDADCSLHWVWSDQYPSTVQVTQSFPHDHYYPDTKYPYIVGPFYHHLVDANYKSPGYRGGHWVWTKNGMQD